MAGLDEDEHSDICSRCKITESKKWYGRKGDRRFCNGAKCRQASREYYNAAAAEAPVLITPVVGRKRVAPEDEEPSAPPRSPPTSRSSKNPLS